MGSWQLESSRRLAEIQELHQSVRAAAEEARRKEEIYKQLVSELETLPRDVSRLAYTQRILEIVGNIRKQKEEITKVCCRGRGGGSTWADTPEGQMYAAWAHKDLTASDRQSHLGTP